MTGIHIVSSVLVDEESGVAFTPFATADAVGYKVVTEDGARTEYIVLSPSTWHQFNPDNGALADTFIYRLNEHQVKEFEDEGGDIPTAFGEPVMYVNHFGRI